MLRSWLARAWSSIASFFRRSTPPLAALPPSTPANDVEVDVDLTDLQPAIERARVTPEASGVQVVATNAPLAQTTIFEDFDMDDAHDDAHGEDADELGAPSERATPTCAPALDLFDASEEPRTSSRPTRRVRLARIAAALSRPEGSEDRSARRDSRDLSRKLG